jgi:uncharacterized protein (DUF58 family)
MEACLESVDPLDSRQFYIAVKKLADSLSYGADRSPFLGSGIEFVQSRPYQWGDPVRAIDWRVTARTRRLHVKEYEAPKRLPCYLMLDTSASMAVSSRPRSKFALAVHLAGGIGLACLDRTSPVGVIGVGGRDFRVEPSLSKQQILEWLLRLRRYRFDEPTRLGQRVAELGTMLTSRALVVVLSDLHDPRAVPALRRLAQRHDVAVVRLEDPAESGLRGSGFIRAREAETGRTFVTHGRRQWRALDQAPAELKRSGIDFLRIATDEPFVERLRHFFRSRDLLGRGAR